MQLQNKPIYRNQYKPPAYFIPKAELDFYIQENHVLVQMNAHFEKNLNLSGDHCFFLDGLDLELKSLTLNGETLEENKHYTRSNEGLTIKNPPPKGEIALSVSLHPANNTALEGLYQSGNILCTQCEAIGFRRIMYFVDRPDNMCEFTVTLKANSNQYPYLLSNGNKLKEIKNADDTHTVTWHDPYKKPSYLFAVVAGDFDVLEETYQTKISNKTIQLSLFVDKGKKEKTHFALKALKKAMLWDEDTYGLEYDLNQYMIVAVDSFNMGAMENKGLNIFNSSRVLAHPDTTTDDDYMKIDSTIAHEYFHNWTGNRVTCRDWFQLSLKEGLTVFRHQQYSADQYSSTLQRISDVTFLKEGQFSEDAGSNAHPVRPEVCYAPDNFYTFTVYEKGAEIVRMINTLVGLDGFKKGIQLYFQTFDGQAVTIEDFIWSMEQANQIDLTQFKKWYEQPGTPKVIIQKDYNKESNELTLYLQQKHTKKPDLSPLFIPIRLGFLNSDGNPLSFQFNNINYSDSILYHFNLNEEKIVFHHIKEDPIVSIFQDFSAPVDYEFNLSNEELFFLLQFDSNLFKRWESGTTLFFRALTQLVLNQDSTETTKLLIKGFEKNLTKFNEDFLFHSQLYRLPVAKALFSKLTIPIDPVWINQCRQKIKYQIATHLENQFFEIYQNLQENSNDSLEKEDIGRRSLKSICLDYLLTTKKPDYFDLALNQYNIASNMTDRMSALESLKHHNCSQRKFALNDFYQKWRKDTQVINYWLSLISSSDLPTTLEEIKQAMLVPEFSIKTPNNARSTIHTFAEYSIEQFHASDGKGYEFIIEKIIELDQINPQVASRLANYFDLCNTLTKNRSSFIKEHLEHLLNQEQLSNNTREKIQKTIHVTEPHQ